MEKKFRTKKRIVVRESRFSWLRVFISIFTIFILVIGGFIALMLSLRFTLESDLPAGAIIAIIVGVLVAYVIIVYISKRCLEIIGKPKVKATPILMVNETPQPHEHIRPALIAFGLAGYIAWIVTNRSKFILCEEGVIFRRNLHRWDSLEFFSVLKDTAHITIKKKVFNSVPIYAGEHLEEVKRILSAHIEERITD